MRNQRNKKKKRKKKRKPKNRKKKKLKKKEKKREKQEKKNTPTLFWFLELALCFRLYKKLKIMWWQIVNPNKPI